MILLAVSPSPRARSALTVKVLVLRALHPASR